MGFSVVGVLEKMSNRDKDFRYMAMSDLLVQLNLPEFELDTDLEKRITLALLKILEDKSSECRALAVRCIGLLARRVDAACIQLMLTNMTDILIGSKDETEYLRDVCSMSLKIVIAECPSGHSALIISVLTPRLLSNIGSSKLPSEVKFHILLVLQALIEAYGPSLDKYNSAIVNALLMCISDEPTLRRKSVQALGRHSTNISGSELASLLTRILEYWRAEQSAHDSRKYILTFAQICRQSGHRPQLHGTIPMFYKELTKLVGIESQSYAMSDVNMDDDADNANDANDANDADSEVGSEKEDEIRETCIQTLEIMLLNCGRQMTSYCEDIMKICLHYVKHDPNLLEMDEDEELDEDFDDFSDDDQLSDDTDVSWKVRRASLKTISALFVSCPGMVNSFWQVALPVLLSRFNEREDIVKSDVFSSVGVLLKQTATLKPYQDAFSDVITTIFPTLVSNVCKEMSVKHHPARLSAINVMKQILSVAPRGLMEEELAILIPSITLCLGEEKLASNIKIECLLLLDRTISSKFVPNVWFLSQLDQLCPLVNFLALDDTSYATTSQSLRVCTGLVDVLESILSVAHDDQRDTVVNKFVKPMCDVVLKRLSAETDVDQEVKEAVITAAAHLVSRLNEYFDKKFVDNVLERLLSKLGNELCRYTAVLSFSEIVQSSVDFSPVLGVLMKDLSLFLRNANRLLRKAALECLTSLAQHPSSVSSISSEEWLQVLAEVANLINESDLHMSKLSLDLSISFLQHLHSSSSLSSNILSFIKETIFPPIFDLIRSSSTSSLIGGSCLASLLDFFQKYTTFAKPDESNTVVLKLQETAYELATPMKSTIAPIAMCLARVANALEDDHRVTIVRSLVEILSEVGNSPRNRKRKRRAMDTDEENVHTMPPRRFGAVVLSLLSLGEIGAQRALGVPERDTIVSMFASPVEEIRAISASSLGCLAVGNLAEHLSFVINEAISVPKHQYLLLHSLREILVRLPDALDSPVDVLEGYRDGMLKLFLDSCRNGEKGIRNVAAECMGKLALLVPEETMAVFLREMNSDSQHVRASILDALKYVITEKQHSIDDFLATNMNAFLSMLQDSDIDVCRAALLMLNHCSHMKPDLIRPVLASTTDVLKSVLRETHVKESLIRIVDLGPMKHQVDDGLELRKSAYQCIYTLLLTSVSFLDIESVFECCIRGLSDDAHDVRILCHLIIARLTVISQESVIDHLDQFVVPLRSTIAHQLKESAVKQEVERNEDLVRSALRAVAALEKLQADTHVTEAFGSLLAYINAHMPLSEKFAELRLKGYDDH